MTVNVTTPLEFVVPLAGVTIEFPVAATRLTVFPDTPCPPSSISVTVMVEEVVLSAATVVGLATTVELVALTGTTVRVVAVDELLKLLLLDALPVTAKTGLV